MYIPLSELLTSSARDDDHPVAVLDGQYRSLGEFRADVAGMTAALQDWQVENLLLIAEDSYAFIVGFMAGLHRGLNVILPANSLPATLDRHRGSNALVLTDMAEIEGEDVMEIRRDQPATPLAPISARDARISFFTSGSSGTPSVILKTLSSLQKEAEVLEAHWGREMDGRARVLSTVSHQHLYGLTFKIIWSLTCGRPIVSNNYAFWEPLVEDLHHPCCIVSSPAHLNRFPPGLTVVEEHGPQMVISGAARLPFENATEARELFGVQPSEHFGSTETGVIAWRHQVSETTPWTIFDEITGGQNADDLLKVRSPFLDDNEWFQLADLVEFVDDKRFFLRGRVDRVVKVDGKKVSLMEVEAALVATDWVHDVAVLKLSDQRESLAAVVKLTEVGQAERDEIGNFRLGRKLRERLSVSLDTSSLPRRWRFVDVIPSNPQGKRLKADLEVLFSAD